MAIDANGYRNASDSDELGIGGRARDGVGWHMVAAVGGASDYWARTDPLVVGRRVSCFVGHTAYGLKAIAVRS